jgi:SAM-dependent methyltransferase
MRFFKKSFGQKYAYVYDAFYADKNYIKEFSNLYTRLSKNNFELFGKKILEIGCGTGNFSVNLGNNNELVAIDPSKEMISIAREKHSYLENSFFFSSIEEFDQKNSSNENFDLIILLFHVFSYLNEQEVESLINLSTRLLKKGGFLVFDYWDRLGTEKFPPRITTKGVKQDNSIYVRVANPINVSDYIGYSINNIKIDIYEISPKSRIKRLLSEIHTLRSYDSQYLDVIMKNFSLKENFDLISGNKYTGQTYGNCKILRNE